MGCWSTTQGQERWRVMFIYQETERAMFNGSTWIMVDKWGWQWNAFLVLYLMVTKRCRLRLSYHRKDASVHDVFATSSTSPLKRNGHIRESYSLDPSLVLTKTGIYYKYETNAKENSEPVVGCNEFLSTPMVWIVTNTKWIFLDIHLCTCVLNGDYSWRWTT